MTGPAAGQPLQILLVEDNPGDVFLFEKALRGNVHPCQLTTVSDGGEAIAYLRRQDRHRHAARPHVVVLDLNLPVRSGLDVLCDVKSDPGLKEIPVVVYSSSSAQDDVLRSYQLHANCYIVKRADIDGLSACIQSMCAFWTSVTELPS